MRRVTIKALYRDLSKEMADLPFEITKGGKHLGYVIESLDKPGMETDTPNKSLDQKPKSLDTEENGLDLVGKIRQAREWEKDRKAMPKKGDK